MKTTYELFLEVEARKLKNQFGAKSFSDEKLTIFWNELKYLEYQTITKIIDELIGNCRFSPTKNELCEQISKYREYKNESEKQNRMHELNRNFKPEEQKRVIAAILQCVEQNNMERLSSIAKKINPMIQSCQKCGGDGVVIALNDLGFDFAFRCDCEVGKKSNESWPIWGGKSSLGLKLKFGAVIK